MSRIFISHSSADNRQAVAICQWLKEEGWDEVFLDLDPEHGIRAGERWEDALRTAAQRCEAVLFLVSRAWLASEWCRDEFRLAHNLRKRLFGVLIEPIEVGDLPAFITREWQVVRLAGPGETRAIPVRQGTASSAVEFSSEGLRRLKLGLLAAGLDPAFFAWPPVTDPERPPYRGLLPLEAEDAGIFFGREAAIVEGLERMRALREARPPRLMVILGASGSGKSSFLRAGLLPRIARDDRNFIALPVLRPARAAINGETGLVRSLETALEGCGAPRARPDIRTAIAGGAPTLQPLLNEIATSAGRALLAEETTAKPPILVLPIDQGEELFIAEGQDEASRLLALLRDLTATDAPAILVLLAMRSDTYDRLQTAPSLQGVHQETMSLPQLPRGAYQAVIERPAERLRGGPRALKIDPALTRKLLEDVESGGGPDALPLIAFTLQRLYDEYGKRGALRLADYAELGGLKGSIEAAVERALAAAEADPRIPHEREARLLMLRRGLVPWLAGIDPETLRPRRRVARLSEIPAEARPLIDLLKEQRLLATDVSPETGELTIEPAHETLLRQWGMLQSWLAEDAGLLSVLEGVKRASRDWAANGKDPEWLSHATTRLEAAERLYQRPDLAAHLEPTDRDYLAACRAHENAARMHTRLVRSMLAALCILAVAGLGYAGWSNRALLTAHANVLIEHVWPKTLTAQAERALAPKSVFKECADCPEMVVVPAGTFTMGAPDNEAQDHDPGNRSYTRDLGKQAYADERPQHQVTFAHPFAVARFEATFEEWDACVMLDGCARLGDEGWGRGRQPVIHVTWDQARQYVAWLASRTGKPYRLLSEAEWEYAARAGSTTAWSWGDDIVKGIADCDQCGSQWDNKRAAPVGSFAANGFGLYDVHGNVWEWVEDCYKPSYEGDPTDGSAVTSPGCADHVLRGGSWYNWPLNIRSAERNWDGPTPRDQYKPNVPETSRGFRVARSLLGPAP